MYIVSYTSILKSAFAEKANGLLIYWLIDISETWGFWSWLKHHTSTYELHTSTYKYIRALFREFSGPNFYFLTSFMKEKGLNNTQ
jgi:hypothetical protein